MGSSDEAVNEFEQVFDVLASLGVDVLPVLVELVDVFLGDVKVLLLEFVDVVDDLLEDMGDFLNFADKSIRRLATLKSIISLQLVHNLINILPDVLELHF